MSIKSHEEIDGLFQAWPESFYNRFGRQVTKDEIRTIIKEIILHKEQQAIETTFIGWNVESLITALNRLDEVKTPFIKDEAQHSNTYAHNNAKKNNKV